MFVFSCPKKIQAVPTKTTTMATTITILRLVFASLAICANLIATPTQHWIDRRGTATTMEVQYPDGQLISIGLYQSCYSKKGCQSNHFRFRRLSPVFNDQENRYPVYESEILFAVVQVFFGVALALQLAFFIMTILHHMGNRLDKSCYNPPFLMGVAYLSILFFTFIGMAVFLGRMCSFDFIQNVFVRYTGGDETEPHINDYRLGWCFYVNLFASVCNLTVAILFFLKNRDDFLKV